MHIDARIRICMAASRLFTPEMVARYGGRPADFRPMLDGLVRRGVLGRGRARSPRSAVFYYRLPAPADTPDLAN